MTCEELLAIARKGRPSVRYARSSQGDKIGGWDATLGRFVMVACLCITGRWVETPYEVLVNGEPCQTDWIE